MSISHSQTHTDTHMRSWSKTHKHSHTQRWHAGQQETAKTIFLLPQEGKEMFEIVDPPRQVVLINPDGEGPVPGCPMVPCLLCTKTPHWEAPVSKWERSGNVQHFAGSSSEIQRIVWLTGQVTWTLRPPWRIGIRVWDPERWRVRRMCSGEGKISGIVLKHNWLMDNGASSYSSSQILYLFINLNNSNIRN